VEAPPDHAPGETTDPAALARARELRTFAKTMQRKPIATSVLLAAIAAVFALQMAFDALEDVPGLVRMGALVPSRVFRGEWWRIGASTFLHGGYLHVALNGYVLWVLGRSTERILGAARFLIVYFVSGIGGALLSATVHQGAPSVGASGAIWGLFAAQAVLAFRPNGLLPTALIPSAKKAALTNLLLNVIVSFQPHVDWAAHAGGGTAGAILVFSGLLTSSLPRLNEPERIWTETSRADLLDARTPAWIRPLAFALGLFYAASIPVALYHGKPWRSGKPLELVRRSSPAQGISFEVPADLEPNDDPSAREFGAVFGNIYTDPAVLEVGRLERAPGPAEEHIQRVLEALRRPPQGMRPVGDPELKTIRGRPSAIARYTARALRLERAVTVTSSATWQVDASVWAQYAYAYGDLAERVIGTIEEIPTERGPGRAEPSPPPSTGTQTRPEGE
jgi:membrane associated rhomboid family serine protease